MIKEYIEYLKDNPHNHWFKAKLYGWGWTPVRWQGWVVILSYIAAIILLSFTINQDSPLTESLFTFILPVFALTIALIYICYKKGEKPTWRWGLPKKK
jgi:hypothetical protein